MVTIKLAIHDTSPELWCVSEHMDFYSNLKKKMIWGSNDAQVVSSARQLNSSAESSLAGKPKSHLRCLSSISGVIFLLQEITTRHFCWPDVSWEVHSQLGRSSCRRSLRAFSDLLLLLALLLASVVGALPHGQPPLRIRGRFGVVVFGQFAWETSEKNRQMLKLGRTLELKNSGIHDTHISFWWLTVIYDSPFFFFFFFLISPWLWRKREKHISINTQISKGSILSKFDFFTNNLRTSINICVSMSLWTPQKW